MTSLPARTDGSPRSLLPLFTGLVLAMLLASLNQTVLATALPTIVGELHGVQHMSWVITAYIVASTVALPVYGRIGDLIGRRSLLIAAILLFVAGSVVGGLAPGMSWLIVGRAVQGLGGGGLILLSQAIIADVVPARERGKYMGVMGATFAVSSVAGPLLGGWITEGPGWRWAFWINLPLGAVALAAALVFLRLPPVRRPGRPAIDYLGMVLIGLTATSLILVATWAGSHYAWTSPTVLGLVGATLLFGALFVLVERRAQAPIIPLGLFRDLNFNVTTAAGLLIGIAMLGALSYLPTYLQMATGSSATRAGMLMIPMMVAMLATSLTAGFYVSRTGRYKWVPIAGSGFVSAGLLLLSTLDVDGPIWLVCVYIAVLGTGLGGVLQLLVLIVQNAVPARIVGTATAANNFFRQLGMSLGAAIVGGVFGARLTGLLQDRLPAGAAIDGGVESLTPAAVLDLPAALAAPVIQSYRDALMPIFLVMVPLGLVSGLLLCFLREKPLATTLERDVPAEVAVEGPVTPVAGDQDARTAGAHEAPAAGDQDAPTPGAATITQEDAPRRDTGPVDGPERPAEIVPGTRRRAGLNGRRPSPVRGRRGRGPSPQPTRKV